MTCSAFCRILIASIMEEYNKDAWETLIKRCEEAGVDAFEVNFSCPHGMPERKMGMAMGQDCEVLEVTLRLQSGPLRLLKNPKVSLRTILDACLLSSYVLATI